MRKLIVLSVLFFFTALHSNAQLNSIHQMELSAACDQVYLHNKTGIPIFKTQNSYVALHPTTFKQMWEIKRQGGAVITEATSSDSYSDYFELPASNIVYVGNNFVDVVTGKVLVDGKAEEVKKLSTFHLFPAKDILVVKTIVKGAYRIYGFDVIKSTLLWKTDIDELGGLSLATIGDSDPVSETTNGLRPYISQSGDIIYVHQKNLMLIDHTTGKLKWKQPLEPGAILFSKSGNLIAVAEKRTGLGSAFVSSTPKFGKKLVVVDAKTGEDAWKKEIKLDGNILFIQSYKDGFIAAHEEGFNIYDFNSTKAEPQWKKDFSAKEISDIVEEGDQIMVYYKDRRVLMDPVSGDEVWKKSEKLEEEAPVFTGGSSIKVGDVKITHSGASLRLHNQKTKGYKSFPAHWFAVDKAKNAVVGVYMIKSDVPPTTDYWFYHADLNTLKVSKTKLDLKQNYSGIYVASDGYFVYGPQSYAFVKMESGKLNIVKGEKYPDPVALERGLLRLAQTVAATNYVVGAMGIGPAYIIGDEASYNNFHNRMVSSDAALEAMVALEPRSTLARIDKKYAFFFSRDDDGNLALFQVNKDDGSETARYKFDDKTPVYEIDYTNGQLYYMNGRQLKIFRLKEI